MAAHPQPHPQPQPQPKPHPLRWRHRLAHSLKWRLVALFLALALGTTAVFVAGTREAFSTGWRELVRPLATDYVDRLASEIGSPPDLARAQAITQRLPLRIDIDGPTLHWSSAPGRTLHLPREPAWRAMLERQTADGHRIVFGVSAWRWDEPPPRWWAWWPLAALLALTALAFAYVRRLFRPLDDIRSGALRYGAGRFDAAIPVRRHDELGELAGQVNAMASNLAHMLEGQRALLLAISHELRSPLTRARLNAELVAEGTERDALLRDLGQMRDLITDLLESERLAGGQAVLQREPTDLNALVAEVVAELVAPAVAEGLAARAGAWPAAPELRLAPALPLLVLDRARIRLLVRNLIANALQHGQGTAVVVATGGDAQGVWLSVRDHGPGVADDQLARLAQPFYRPDAARSRSGGGVGLGLYLCRLVARAHGGELQLRHAGPGLEARVQIPLNAPDHP